MTVHLSPSLSEELEEGPALLDLRQNDFRAAHPPHPSFKLPTGLKGLTAGYGLSGVPEHP